MPFLYDAALAQQKEKTVAVSCYVNPELYLQAGIIAQVTDKDGNTSCSGKYVTLVNKSENAFYYKLNNRWILIKPGGRAVAAVGGSKASGSASPSVLKIEVKYLSDRKGGMASKLSAITQMNLKTDAVQSRELAAIKSPKVTANTANESIAVVNKPSVAETRQDVQAKPASVSTAPAKVVSQDLKPSKPEPTRIRKNVVAKTKAQSQPKRTKHILYPIQPHKKRMLV